jgi:hypothetical protein
VEVPVEVMVPVPAQWTRPIPYPPPFGAEITIKAATDRVFELYDLLDQANADRASVKEISE